MPRYVVEEGAIEGRPRASHGPFDGLAVAKAVARKTADETGRPTTVRDADSRETVARLDPAAKVRQSELPTAPAQPTALAQSVRRLKAANDELTKALKPSAERRSKG